MAKNPTRSVMVNQKGGELVRARAKPERSMGAALKAAESVGDDFLLEG